MNKKSKNSKPAWSVFGILMLINAYIFLMQKEYIISILFSFSALCFLFASFKEKKNTK